MKTAQTIMSEKNITVEELKKSGYILKSMKEIMSELKISVMDFQKMLESGKIESVGFDYESCSFGVRVFEVVLWNSTHQS